MLSALVSFNILIFYIPPSVVFSVIASVGIYPLIAGFGFVFVLQPVLALLSFNIFYFILY